jgi:hypothetical protein
MMKRNNIFLPILIAILLSSAWVTYEFVFQQPSVEVKRPDGELFLMNEEDIEDTFGRLKNTIKGLEEDLKMARGAKEGLTTNNRTLIQNMQSLINDQENRRQEGRKLKKQFLKFDQLAEEEKSDLLKKVLYYLDPQTNPEIEKRIIYTIQSLVNQERQRQEQRKDEIIDSLQQEIVSLKTEITSLKYSIKVLELDKQTLQEDLDKAMAQLGKARQIIRDNSQVVSDTVEVLNGTDSTQKQEILDLVHYVDSINNILKNIVPVSLTTFEITPVKGKFVGGLYRSKGAGVKIELQMDYVKPVTVKTEEFVIECELRYKSKRKLLGEKVSRKIKLDNGSPKRVVVGEGFNLSGSCVFKVWYGSVLLETRQLKFK